MLRHFGGSSPSPCITFEFRQFQTDGFPSGKGSCLYSSCVMATLRGFESLSILHSLPRASSGWVSERQREQPERLPCPCDTSEVRVLPPSIFRARGGVGELVQPAASNPVVCGFESHRPYLSTDHGPVSERPGVRLQPETPRFESWRDLSCPSISSPTTNNQQPTMVLCPNGQVLDCNSI